MMSTLLYIRTSQEDPLVTKAEAASAIPFYRDINIRFRAYFTNNNVNASMKSIKLNCAISITKLRQMH